MLDEPHLCLQLFPESLALIVVDYTGFIHKYTSLSRASFGNLFDDAQVDSFEKFRSQYYAPEGGSLAATGTSMSTFDMHRLRHEMQK